MLSEKSKVTAALLCFFGDRLGSIGFTWAKSAREILWLLTLGVLGIGTLAAFVLRLFGKDKDKKGLLIQE